MSHSASIANRRGDDTTPPAPPADLKLERLTKRFGSFTAVDDVSLEVAQGEFVTLLGPSGCGKTTTLRIIAGLEQATSGTVSIQGKVANRIPPHQRNVNTVFQNYALLPHLSVFENVAFGLRLKRLPRAEIERRVHEMLQRMRLAIPPSAARTNSAAASSSGWPWRALVNSPAILLLDEPLGALDLKLRKAMQLELKQLQRAVGITFIYVTHDQEEAMTLSDRIVVMNHGRTQQIDAPARVYHRPRNAFVADFIGVSNFFPGALREQRDGFVWVGVDGVGDLVCRPSDPPPSGERVVVAVRSESVRLSDHPPLGEANVIQGHLEDLVVLGPLTQAFVQLPNGQLVQCDDHSAAPAVRERGRAAWLTWPVDAATAFDAVWAVDLVAPRGGRRWRTS